MCRLLSACYCLGHKKLNKISPIHRVLYYLCISS
jgi:hypothetical protein